jgi:sulfoxide reductase catalytic subunit YedY
MLTRIRRGWELPESAATPETIYRERRSLVKALAAGPILLAGGGLLAGCDDPDQTASKVSPMSRAHAEETDPTADLYPVPRNETYTVQRAITDEKSATTFNNFYEFGSHKQIAKDAQALPLRPWTVTFDGMVEKEKTVDFDSLIRQMPLEERVYRHRCVEAWAMTVPWSGFAMKALVDFAAPLGWANWNPWPYVEGLTIEEARNDLAFIATGLYGRPIPKQNGAPLRLAVPWKYGFKSIKSIVRFSFTDQRPTSFWEDIQSREYGFWANVNPEVSHPRWSQAEERLLGADSEGVPTRIYNGYGEFVAHLYEGLQDEKLFM